MRWRVLPWVTALVLFAALAACAGAVLAEPAPATGAGTPVVAPAPLAERLSPWFAAAIGSLGSAAYLIAVWVGLVGRSDGRDRVLAHFKKLWGLKVPLYLAGGGGVAMVFQLPEAKLVPVQAFIIGCTWPAVVANYLSGRQSGEGEEQVRETLQRQQDAERLKSVVVAVPEARTPSPALDAGLDQLMADVSKPRGPTGATAPGKSSPPAPVGGGPTGAGKG